LRQAREYGCEVHRGLAKTGVVGTAAPRNSLRAVGLRADMDCLPMQELNSFAHASTHEGRMHACGHDGTPRCCSALRASSPRRAISKAPCISSSSRRGGRRRRQGDDRRRLFEKFPCDGVFAMHNMPDIPVGHFGARPGPLLASSDRFDIRIKGYGTHAAHPDRGIDPFVIGAQITLALQTIVSRNMDPIDNAIVTIGFHEGRQRLQTSFPTS